jgi:hypothetical protein
MNKQARKKRPFTSATSSSFLVAVFLGSAKLWLIRELELDRVV